MKPATAVRVRFGTNEPTPWPPELPAGENPPPGAILDYYLPADASGPVTLEILDAAGKVVRSYSSIDPVLKPEPGVDMEGYDQVCRKRPTATYCGLPLYWPAQEMKLGTTAGMHRAWWDMHFEPFEVEHRRQRRRGRHRRRPPPHLSRCERAVGAAGSVFRAAHGQRKDLDPAAHAAARSASEDSRAGADPARHALAPVVRRCRGRARGECSGAGAGGEAAEPRGDRRRRVQGAGRFAGARALARRTAQVLRPRAVADRRRWRARATG